MPETLPWWKSRVIIGALVSALFKLLFALGLSDEIADDELSAFVEVALLLASFVGDFIAARARVVQKVAPQITVRK